MKIHAKRGYDRWSLHGTKAVYPWSHEPAAQSGLDIAPHPKLSPRFGGSTQGRLVFFFDVPRRRKKGVDHGNY
jgi:hypothetical protein